MKRLSYEQMIIGLDQLFFEGKLSSQIEAEERVDTIEAYIEACGWNWDSILEHTSHEESTVRDPGCGSREDVCEAVPKGSGQAN